jgi:YhcH/YjgK/YiaL family protein
VQYVASGSERIGIASLHTMTVDMPHDTDRDVAFFHGTGDWFTLPAGSFAIFMPQDVHRPCVQVSAAERVRKIVLKAAIEC